MFDHVTVRASERDASLRFYDTVLSTLGIERSGTGAEYLEWDDSLDRRGRRRRTR